MLSKPCGRSLLQISMLAITSLGFLTILACNVVGLLALYTADLSPLTEIIGILTVYKSVFFVFFHMLLIWGILQSIYGILGLAHKRKEAISAFGIYLTVLVSIAVVARIWLCHAKHVAATWTVAKQEQERVLGNIHLLENWLLGGFSLCGTLLGTSFAVGCMYEDDKRIEASGVV